MVAESADLTRDALQVAVNEADAEGDGPGFMVMHYAAVVGLYRANADGTTDSDVVVVSPPAQPGYITEVLLAKAPGILAAIDEAAAGNDDGDD